MNSSIRLIANSLTVAAGLLSLSGAAWAGPAENKIAATNAMIDLFAKQDPSGVERYFVGAETPYIQHNTGIPDGIEPLKGLAKQATTWSGVHVIVRRGLAEGDLVVLHNVYSNLVGNKGQAVAFDLFRFTKDGKIVEHYDALERQVAPDESGLVQTDGSVDIVDRDKGDANRKVVIGFIEAVLIQAKPEQAAKFIDTPRFVAHTAPRREDGLVRKQASFVAAAAPAKQGRYTKIHKTIAEGNFVFVQGEGRVGAEQVLEIYDLFRLQGGKIVEHWDVLQPLRPAAQWANPNGPF